MLRHPRRTLAAALLVIAALISVGFGLEDRLTPSSLEIGGTPVHRANNIVGRYFGDSAPFAILLRGNPGAIDRQGPSLVRSLNEDPRVTTLSPWDRGRTERLRPSAREALIIVDFHVGLTEATNEKVAYLNNLLEAKIHPPVSATQSSFYSLSRSIQDESITAAERGELIALPILLVVLLLVFRSPVAAGVPLGFGAISVFCSRGLLSIATHFFEVSALALTVCSMMGLALGVDYALLLVSRFREELAAGADPLEAAWATRRTAGRTVAFAGSTLVLSMVVALFVVPGVLLVSLAGSLAMVVVLTVLVATLLGPPILVLIGPRIDLWRIGPAPNGERSKLMTVVAAALRRPVPVSLAIGGVVLLLASPALALKTGPFSINQLPHGDPARVDAETVQKSFAGFEAPFTIIAAAQNGTITDPHRLAVLSRWQRRIAEEPGVESVVGPEQVAKAVEPLRKAGTAVYASNEETGPLASLNRLSKGIDRVANGVGRIRDGLSQATAGAGLLAEGSGRAEEGASQIASGIGQAIAGSRQALSALDKIAAGNRQLAKANEKAALGGLQVKLATQSFPPNLNLNALPPARKLTRSLAHDSKGKVPSLQAAAQAGDEKLNEALQGLEGMTVGKSDPNYAATLDALRQAASATAPLPGELTALEERLAEDASNAKQVKYWLESSIKELKKLAAASKRLSDGLNEIKGGSKKLAAGTERLDQEATKQSTQLAPAHAGAEELVAGLARLTGGTTELQKRLGEFYSRSYPLQSGTRRLAVRVQSQGESVNRRVDRARNASPDIFNSGYFVLAALDGTRGELHERASEAVDLNRGGQATTITVFSRYPFNSKGSIGLNRRLERDAKGLEEEAGVVAGVAGGPPTLNTYSRVTRDKLPLEIAAITLATFLVLVLVLRALPLAAIAVGLNLATVAVAFGVLTLLNQMPADWPLGGREYVDAVGMVMIFGIVFGLSIDYAVFLLVRMREHYDRDGDNAAAIEFGLEKTARVITGAAVIMMAVFIAFAGAPIATVSEIGIGLTVAVLLDATVVRIVLLPALMLLIGDRVWWLPKRLERVLPRLNV